MIGRLVVDQAEDRAGQRLELLVRGVGHDRRDRHPDVVRAELRRVDPGRQAFDLLRQPVERHARVERQHAVPVRVGHDGLEEILQVRVAVAARAHDRRQLLLDRGHRAVEVRRVRPRGGVGDQLAQRRLDELEDQHRAVGVPAVRREVERVALHDQLEFRRVRQHGGAVGDRSARVHREAVRRVLADRPAPGRQVARRERAGERGLERGIGCERRARERLERGEHRRRNVLDGRELRQRGGVEHVRREQRQRGVDVALARNVRAADQRLS